MVFGQRSLVIGLVSMSLAACTANQNTAYRLRNVTDDASATILTIDAKQRSVLMGQRPLKDGKPDPAAVRAFCAEPSPDVFSVMAQSLSAGGSFGKSADPASIQAALNLAYGSAEQGSTIPRTQTINMLRELMYRTCERYLGGGYDAGELSLQAIRDQRLMVSILAIEQLTGAVTPKPVVIGATGSGTAGAGGEAIVRLDDARKARDDATVVLAKATTAYDEANGKDKVCDAIKGKKEDELTPEQKKCEKLRSAKDEALADQATKAAAYQELSTLARAGGVTVATGVSTHAPGGLDQAAASDAISNVATAVSAIVKENFNDQTEVMMFCMRTLRTVQDLNLSGSQKESLKSVCLSYLDTGVSAAEMKLTAGIARSNAILVTAQTSAFSDFWTPARAAQFRDATERGKFTDWLRPLLNRRSVPVADCFAAATDRSAVEACFDKLGPQMWTILIQHPE